MSARNIILGLLRERPGNSYEIVVRFDRRVGPWEINRGQVYRTVSDLKGEGLVEEIESADSAAATARKAKFWRITEAGERVLDDWLASPCEDVEPMRGDLLARLAAAGLSDIPDLLVSLDLYEREIVSCLEADFRSRRESPAEDEWERDMIDITYDSAILRRDAELNWVRRVRELLQSWVERERAAGRDVAARRVVWRDSAARNAMTPDASVRSAAGREAAVRRAGAR